MVAALIACTMVSLASREEFKVKPKIMVSIAFEKAIKDPGLVLAMKQQLNPSFLLEEKPVYVVKVRYHNTFYHVSGTRAQWVKFFTPIYNLPAKALGSDPES